MSNPTVGVIGFLIVRIRLLSEMKRSRRSHNSL